MQAKFAKEELHLTQRFDRSTSDRRRDSFLDSKRDLVKKLERMGIVTDDEALHAKENESSLQFKQSQEEVQSRNDLQAYETYERVWNLVLGLNAADVIVGNTRITCSTQGADFMDIIPEVPSIISIKDKFIHHIQTLRDMLTKEANTI